ncbi:MAG: carbohydrate ABC transporter permease, partial [Clostridiales bacterium]|nr:carbohydrate ABC transporter permease [Clostridiales bacterium]
MENIVSKNIAGQIVMHIICVLLCVTCVAPFALLIVSSFTQEASLVQNGYSFLPKAWSLEA